MYLIRDNPFLSEIFTSKWLKHFNDGQCSMSFSLFSDLVFVKNKRLPLYVNVGKTQTKGISYSISSDKDKKYKNKVFLIYDVPEYFHPENNINNPLKVLKTSQYPGFIVYLKKYSSFEDYMASVFNAKSRYKIRSYRRNLEDSFSISYKMFYGAISKKEYDEIFGYFRTLLERRFEDKQETNNNLNSKEWDFYCEVVYPMVLEKKASIYVVYDNQKPIGVMLSFMSENIIFVAITVFDISYSKFNVGTVNITQLLEWAIEQKIEIVDFSKGYYDYKTRWGSIKYKFEYHIAYDSKSIKATSLAYSIFFFFKIKQFFRNKGVNTLLHKFTFFFRNRKMTQLS